MVLGRAIRGDVPPLSLAFWRWAIALALTLPLALPHLRTQWPLLKRGWPAIVILGLLGVGGYNTLAYVALQYADVYKRQRPRKTLKFRSRSKSMAANS